MSTDYTRVPIWTKIGKVARYARMYGPRRTIAKARGQYHMKASYTALPECNPPATSSKHVGIVGCGNFSFSNIAYFLRKNEGAVIRGVMDIDANRAASLYEHYRADYYTQDANDLFADPNIDLVYVASNHSTHADYAIAALRAGKAVHVEKPHVVDHDQLERLLAAAHEHQGRLRVGFNRPSSDMGKMILEALEAEQGSAMINWFVVGHQIDRGHWYHDPREKGRVLGNLCHWSDFTLRMVPEASRYPLRIVPVRTVATDCDIAVNYIFGDGTIGVVTFSAKGSTADGVRELLSAQKGDAVVSLQDFRELTIERGSTRRHVKPWLREHGHEASIMESYRMSRRGGSSSGDSHEYVRQTAELFLATREALETNTEVVLERGGEPSLVAREEESREPGRARGCVDAPARPPTLKAKAS